MFIVDQVEQRLAASGARFLAAVMLACVTVSRALKTPLE
jgi:hypothetical protein